ncbi:MAG: ABC transporter ATP-binding protein [Gammaproteobacteria bacterium]|nr:ABC transporter ATP-binding protein [Gammaproteobacteria bacterium]
MEVLLEVRNLFKSYGKVNAVNGISFQIKKGQCLGLLGPNGAGKTTTIEMMEGIAAPTSGEVLYKDKPLDHDFRQQAGIQFQATSLQDFLSVEETLRMFHSLYTHPADMQHIIDMCALHDILDRDNRKLSGGQRQRLLLALALVNDPEIVFLDEPTTGLDPQSRRNFWNLIEGIKARGKTIVLTTHYMDEAYVLCDEILIVDQGKIIAEGTPNALLDKHFNESIVRLPTELLSSDWPDNNGKLHRKNGWAEIHTSDVEGVISEFMHRKIPLAKVEMRKWNLEDLFITLTGKDLRN